MLEKIENAFKDLLASLEVAKLYETSHPVFLKSLDKAFASLQEILSQKGGLVLGIIGDELAFEKEIFFQLSKLLRPAIIYLREKGIEKIAFYRGLEKDELNKFIAYLAATRDQTKKDAQEYLSLAGIKNIAVGKLKTSDAAVSDQEVAPLSSSDIYDSSAASVSLAVENFLNTQAIDHLAVKIAINNIMEDMTTRYQEFLKLTTVRRYDLGTFAHLLNVSILAMYFSSKIGFSKDVILNMGIAGLFHDIGKLHISRKVITKKDRLTDDEFIQMKSHTTLGAELLLEYVDTLGILPVVVAFEHHLKYNLTGYPKVSFPKKPHIASLIVCICDVYDALSERRGYKADYPPDMIYNLMIKEKGSAFDPMLVDKFFEIMGVWPIGSIVALSNGQIAVVREENEDDILSPKVEIIHPEQNHEVIDLKEAKDKIKIERYLNPWKEGKDFLHLIGAPAPKKI